jgi:hypothetical protein
MQLAGEAHPLLLDQVERYLEQRGDDDVARHVVTVWRETLDDLADPTGSIPMRTRLRIKTALIWTIL